MADATNSPAKSEAENNDTKQETTVENAVEVTENQAPIKEMKSVVLTNFGGLKSVKIQNKPQPTPSKGEVLIRVEACGLSFWDLMVRQGLVNNLPKLPFIMGLECAGEVEEIGEEVSDLQVGDRVVAFTEYKAWAEFAVVPAKFVYTIPKDMSFKEAAAMLMSFVVAYCLVFDIGGVKEGQKVFLHSAGGSVGQAISQLVKTIGDVTLIGTASKHKHEWIGDSFAHLIDHSVDYLQEVKKIAPEGVDVVLDCRYGDDKSFGLLKPMGRYVLYGKSSMVSGESKNLIHLAKSWWQVGKLKPMKLYDENRSLSGFHLIHLLHRQNGHKHVRNVVSKVLDLWADGKVKPVIDSTWAFEDIQEAMQKLHDRKNVGKVLMDPKMEPKEKPIAERKDSKKSIENQENKSIENQENKSIENQDKSVENQENNTSSNN